MVEFQEGRTFLVTDTGSFFLVVGAWVGYWMLHADDGQVYGMAFGPLTEMEYNQAAALVAALDFMDEEIATLEREATQAESILWKLCIQAGQRYRPLWR